MRLVFRFKMKIRFQLFKHCGLGIRITTTIVVIRIVLDRFSLLSLGLLLLSVNGKLSRWCLVDMVSSNLHKIMLGKVTLTCCEGKSWLKKGI